MRSRDRDGISQLQRIGKRIRTRMSRHQDQPEGQQ
jgi:hypothetical protein